MKYSVRKRRGLFCVHELKTDQIIEKFELKEEASALARFLESGGGFAGETPRFFVENVAIITDENYK